MSVKKGPVDVRSMFLLKDYLVDVRGISLCLRRPSVLDFIAAIEFSKKSPDHFSAWLVWQHLHQSTLPVFSSLDDVLQCDVSLVNEIAEHIEKLYGEGKH